jgi:hypothetical protein
LVELRCIRKHPSHIIRLLMSTTRSRGRTVDLSTSFIVTQFLQTHTSFATYTDPWSIQDSLSLKTNHPKEEAWKGFMAER